MLKMVELDRFTDRDRIGGVRAGPARPPCSTV
jgi:hypothetical protein